MPEQETPPAASYIILAAFFVLVAASAMVWRWALGRWLSGRPLLANAPRSSVPWGLIDLGGAIVIFISLTLLAVLALAPLSEAAVKQSESLDAQMQLFVADSLLKLATLAAMVVYLCARFIRPWSDLGWAGFSLTSLKYGACAFAFTAVPVYALQTLLTQFVPYTHPLIEALKEDPQPTFFLVSTLAAVIVAPLFEEYFVRVLLQGWLENIARRDVKLETLVLGESRAERLRQLFQPPVAEPVLASVATAATPAILEPVPEAVAPEAVAESAFPVPALPATGDDNPYAVTASPFVATVATAATEQQPAPPPRSALSFAWPVVVSSAVFALLHVGHGPDPIPLFFLALGLGYLYQRTGSMWPGVFMHAMFNAWSLGLLWLYVSAG